MVLGALSIDWNEVSEEACTLLRDYLRINTTNPPGGEEAGAIFLREALKRDGIESTFYDAGDGRVSISARIPARTNTGKKPLVLLSHIDVVPAEESYWKVDPFGGEMIDGVIWGRGALDMKGMGIMELLIMALVKRHDIELDRDLVLVAVADEEEGGLRGIHFLQESHPEILEAEYIFNEGAYGFSEFMGQAVKIIGLSPSEKCPVWLKLRASGDPGHASVPHGSNAVVRLVQALGRIEDHKSEVELTPPVEAMLRTLRDRGFLPAELDPRDTETVKMLASVDAHLHAITHDTVNLTGFHSGHKHNVIPASAEATLDCRLLPTRDYDGFLEELRAVIDDPGIEVETIYRRSAGTTSLDTPVSAAVEAAVRGRLGEEAFVMPMLSPGFTDSHAFRAAGGNAYGFTPQLLTREELSTIHGHNERVSVENMRLGTELLMDVVLRLAAS